jgi:hypothetical protein
MRQFPVVVLASLVAVIAFTSGRSIADEPKAKPANKLVGTWKEVSAKYDGNEARPPEGFKSIKHVTPTHFMWVDLDKDGNATGAFGGPYTLTGDKYEETFEYGFGDLFKSLRGKTQSFTCKVEGNKWYHNGKTINGATLEEVWERVEKVETK